MNLPDGPSSPSLPPATPAEPASSGVAPEKIFASSAAGVGRDWKAALRADFESWLASVDQIPPEFGETDDDGHESPDLYSFYAQFVAANAETRKVNRRTAEAISQWGETLVRFENGLQPLRDTTAQLASAQPKSGRLSRAHCLIVVELLDRVRRLDAAFQSPPARARAWWKSNDQAWRGAWETQHQALQILASHLSGWLEKEGVVRLASAGKAFDPTVMAAVAAEANTEHPPQTVLEELAPGYLRDGELLRAAQVKVARGS